MTIQPSVAVFPTMRAHRGGQQWLAGTEKILGLELTGSLIPPKRLNKALIIVIVYQKDLLKVWTGHQRPRWCYQSDTKCCNHIPLDARGTFFAPTSGSPVLATPLDYGGL